MFQCFNYKVDEFEKYWKQIEYYFELIFGIRLEYNSFFPNFNF